MKSMVVYGLKLGLVCLVATGLLALTNALTGPKINQEAQKELNQSLKEVLVQADKFEPVKKMNTILYYKAYDKEGKFIGAAFIVLAKGYSSTIETLVGMTKEATITAIKVLNQNETPGLGSKIAEVKQDGTLFDAMNGKKSHKCPRPWFQAQFCDKKVKELDKIQAITGATISSKAVIDAVKVKTKEIEELIKDEK